MTGLLRLGARCGVLSGSFIALPGAGGAIAATSVVIGPSPASAVPLPIAPHLARLRALSVTLLDVRERSEAWLPASAAPGR